MEQQAYSEITTNANLILTIVGMVITLLLLPLGKMWIDKMSKAHSDKSDEIKCEISELKHTQRIHDEIMVAADNRFSNLEKMLLEHGELMAQCNPCIMQGDVLELKKDNELLKLSEKTANSRRINKYLDEIDEKLMNGIDCTLDLLDLIELRKLYKAFDGNGKFDDKFAKTLEVTKAKQPNAYDIVKRYL
jgi:hypothetical protein